MQFNMISNFCHYCTPQCMRFLCQIHTNTISCPKYNLALETLLKFFNSSFEVAHCLAQEGGSSLVIGHFNKLHNIPMRKTLKFKSRLLSRIQSVLESLKPKDFGQNTGKCIIEYKFYNFLKFISKRTILSIKNKKY